MKRSALDRHNYEKQLLAEKLKSLTDKSREKKLLLSQFDESSAAQFRPLDTKRQKRWHQHDDPAKSIYEKYGHMWRRSTRETEEKIFGSDHQKAFNNNNNGNNNRNQDDEEEDEEDAFFLDPTKETHKKVLEQNKKLVHQDLRSFHHKSHHQQQQKQHQQLSKAKAQAQATTTTTSNQHSNSGGNSTTVFIPYENKNFWGAGGEYEPHFEKRDNVKYGKAVCTPRYDEMIALDPKNWRANVNFIPIPKSQNKYLQMVERRKRKLALQKQEQQKQNGNNNNRNNHYNRWNKK